MSRSNLPMQIATVVVGERVALGEDGTRRGTVDAFVSPVLPLSRRGRHAARAG